MKNNINVTFKRLCATLIALTLMLSINSTYAFASNTQMDSDVDVSQLPYGTSVTYNVETHDILYGMDQGEEKVEEVLNKYDITPSLVTSSASDNGYTRVGNVLGSPYRNICYVAVKFPDGTTGHGSGTLVYTNVLLTAGHIIYSHEHGGWATSVTVYPAKDGMSNNLGSAKSTNLTTNSAWVNNKDHEWDWGIVDLDKGFDTWQIYGYYNDYKSNVGTKVTALGYPGGTAQFYKSTRIIDIKEKFCIIDAKPIKGISGGPLINNSDGALVGIISCSVEENENYSWVVNITPDLFSRLQKHQQEVS